MKAPRFITNPRQGERAERVRTAADRTLMIITLALVGGGAMAAAVVAVIVEMPVVAGIVLVAELIMAVYLRVVLTKSTASKYPDLLVAGSYLSGIEINEFAQPQQLWDAAVAVRDTGDKARARMILGS